MAKLAGKYPGFPELGAGMDGMAEQKKVLAELRRRSDALPEGEIVDALVEFPVADGAALYIVTSARPLTVQWIDWMDGYSAAAATIRGLNRADIEAQIRYRRTLTNMFRQGDDWWAEQEIGATLHYHNGFGEYVRGEVVVLTDGDRAGLKGIRPVALVGNWKPYDLPQRRPDGSVAMGYHASKIVEGGPDAAWRPSDSCVYEAPRFVGPRGAGDPGDPRTLPALDLTVPPMSDDAQETARLFALAEQAGLILEGIQPETARETLALAREVLNV
jgi:hypothetical protein